LHDLLQDVAVEREVGDQPLEFAILLAPLPQLAQFAQAKAGVFLLPDVEGRLADAVLAANLAHPGAALGLAQRAQDLLLAVALLRHSRALLSLLQRTTPQARFSTYGRHTFRVLGHTGKELLSRLSSQLPDLCPTGPQLRSLQSLVKA
jgi:hypothetical protein